MNSFDTVLFDLDGTLTDPRVGITTSVQYALHHFGIEVENPDTLCKFIGPPLIDSFMEYYGFTEEEAKAAAAKYRERFSVTGIFENVPYPGVEEMLATLKSRGKTLCVATSKPEAFALRILEHFHLKEYFTFVGGSCMDGRRGKKGEVIAYVLGENHLTDLTRVVMVGDRLHDIHGAKENGLASIGVLYGYGDRPELEAAGADYVVADFLELLALLP